MRLVPRSRESTYTIGDVSTLTGIEIHTLRYWEKEFAGYLEPARTPGGQRRYDSEAIQRVREIHRLLKQERYTVEGAKKHLARQTSGTADAA